ncbi:hypothetical protein GCM10010507_30920 [Streptomyces cinnamoneus]|uniref:Uncharacterized protein n=1 Tax=Streptomyces cinnamoneus TaxID=53446 RepID=A0A918TN82_STRCJ|nr:hypothetical protein GCM10010507_30920 [Streptomyces cinnamoneus]
MVSVTRPCSAPGPRRRIGPGSPPTATGVATGAGRGATGVATGHPGPAAGLRPQEVARLLLWSYPCLVRSDAGLMCGADPRPRLRLYTVAAPAGPPRRPIGGEV